MWKPSLSGAIRAKLIWITPIVLALAAGILLGIFLEYAIWVEHPIASKPIKVDYCFLFSHEDLFRGQPIETDAHYSLGMEGAGIDKDECPENAALFSGPPAEDPIGKEWDKDIKRQWFPAEFNISFVGVIPSYPRYRRWYADAKNFWPLGDGRPGHHVPFIQIQRLTHFERTR